MSTCISQRGDNKQLRLVTGDKLECGASSASERLTSTRTSLDSSSAATVSICAFFCPALRISALCSSADGRSLKISTPRWSCAVASRQLWVGLPHRSPVFPYPCPSYVQAPCSRARSLAHQPQPIPTFWAPPRCGCWRLFVANPTPCPTHSAALSLAPVVCRAWEVDTPRG